MQPKYTIVNRKFNIEMLNIAMRLLTHFERKGFNLELMNIVYPKIDL